MAAERRVIIPYAPRRQFLPYHRRTQRWACIVAHRRAGKTVACVNELIKGGLTCERQAPRFAYIAPFYRQAKDVAWTYVKHFAAPLGADANESELRVTLPNGASIRLYGADNPDSLRGIYLDGVVMDEPADMKPSLWKEVIRPSLSDRLGWATFIGTPKGENDFFEIWTEAKDSPDWYALMLKASESGILPAAELADARRTLGEDRYEQEYECSFSAALMGAFWGREMNEAAAQGRIGPLPWSPDLPVETAWDVGRSDDTSIWFWQAHRGQIRVIDHYATNGEGAAHYAKVLHGKPYVYRKHWLPRDALAKTAAAERSFIEQLQALGVKPIEVVAPHSVQDGIQSARALLPRCWFDAEKCRDGLKALRQYQRLWDEDRKTFRDAPLHDWTSHAADAFRYMAVSLQDELPELKPRRLNTQMPTLGQITAEAEKWARQRDEERI